MFCENIFCVNKISAIHVATVSANMIHLSNLVLIGTNVCDVDPTLNQLYRRWNSIATSFRQHLLLAGCVTI